MIEIIVQRGSGDTPGPDIADALIKSVPVALARGAAEINRQCSNRKILGLSTVLVPFIQPGNLVKITTTGGSRVGQVKTFEKEYTLSQTEFRAECVVSVEVMDE